MNTLLPIFLNLAGRPVVIVGGGPVALRRARRMVEAGAVVTVVAPEFVKGFERLPVGMVTQRWTGTHLRGAVLVVAATDDREVNRVVANNARAKNIPANIADDPVRSDFHFPAIARRDPVAIAISTGGASPAVAAKLRKKIEALLDKGWSQLAREAGVARAKAQTPAERRRLQRKIAAAQLPRKPAKRRSAR